MIESYCGIKCNEYECRVKFNCPGCRNAKGNIFWGQCPVSKCCISKKHDHCGKCPLFPCSLLTEMAFDKENGDDGERIENLKKEMKGNRYETRWITCIV